MRIVMVTEYLAPKNQPRFGGVDVRTINLAKCLAKKNDVHIVTTYIEGSKRLENYDNVIIHRIGKKRKFTQRGDFLQRLRFNSQVISEITRLHPDIVDGSGPVSYVGSSKGAKKVCVPSLVTVHEVWQGEWLRNMGLINGFAGHFLEKHYLSHEFSGYIAVSKFTKEKLIKKMGIDEEKITVVYNGIDLDLFNNITIDKKYSEPTIITICRLVTYKRVDDLIRAVKILIKDIPNIKLKIIGTGPQMEYLIQLSKNLGIRDHVDFLGKISDTKDLIRVLKKSHIFSLPSIAEGFGIVIIEAMAAGIPYVASDIPPIREISNGGIGGLLCKPMKYEDLAEKIKLLCTDNSLRTNRMENARKHLMQYSWDSVANDLETVYEKYCHMGDNRKDTQ